MMVVKGKADLFEVVGARNPAGCFTCLLHSRKQQANKDADDGNHNEEFDEGERSPSLNWCGSSHEKLSWENMKRKNFVRRRLFHPWLN